MTGHAPECLRALLWESEANLEMKIFNTPSFFVWRLVTLGDEQKQAYFDWQMYCCHGNRTWSRKPQVHVLS